MAIITCPACEQRLPDDLANCVVCGHLLPVQPADPDDAAPAVRAASEAGQLHALALRKLALLSFFSLGLYQVYWFYRNWRRVRERTGRSLMPLARAIFAPVWSHSLFDEVAEQARAADVRVGWSPIVLAVSFFLLSAAWRFPGAGLIVSLFSFLPLLPVQATINAIAGQRGTAPDARIDARHRAVIAAGTVLVIMTVIGATMQPPPAP